MALGRNSNLCPHRSQQRLYLLGDSSVLFDNQGSEVSAFRPILHSLKGSLGLGELCSRFLQGGPQPLALSGDQHRVTGRGWRNQLPKQLVCWTIGIDRDQEGGTWASN